jgi:uncharacterized protein YbaP (TraB family)
MSMKRILAWMLIAALLLSAVGCTSCVKMAVSQMPEGDKKPVMWKATDADGHTLYLFGTIHVGDERIYTVTERISPVLESCDALAVEFDMVAYEKNVMSAMKDTMQYMLPSGSVVADYMPEDLYARVYDLLNRAGLFPAMQVRYNLAMWSQLAETALIMECEGLDVAKSMDRQLVLRANEKEIPVREVESASYQMELLNSFSDELYLLMIEDAVNNEEACITELTKTYELWLSGDREAFWSFIAEENGEDDAAYTAEQIALLEDYNRKLNDERNLGMRDKALEYLAGGDTVFFAVGSAHMANEAGLVQLLTDAGCTVETVEY